jgi:hypothetical protein
MQPYHEASVECPVHLRQAIDALSLSYLWHQVDSDCVLSAAVRSYVRALSQTRLSLQSWTQEIGRETVLAALILDIVDKILSSCSRALAVHVNGALGLAKMIGLNAFPNESVLRMLSNQSMISSLAQRQPLDPEVVCWRVGLEDADLSNQHPRGMTGLFARYADLQHQFATNHIPRKIYVGECIAMDNEIARMEAELPAFWQYRHCEVNSDSQHPFGGRSHVYSHRNICQARNLQRVCRLLLNEAMLENTSNLKLDRGGIEPQMMAQENIDQVVQDICLSVPSFAICRVSEGSITACAQGHSSLQVGDCHTLLFPLYAAARSKVSTTVRQKVMSYLRYIADHFSIRAAALVIQELDHESDLDIWEMYVRLGSYAFHM